MMVIPYVFFWQSISMANLTRGAGMIRNHGDTLGIIEPTMWCPKDSKISL